MRTRSTKPSRTLLAAVILLAGAALIALSWRSYSDSTPEVAPPAATNIPSVHGEGLLRRTLYRSPQRPGYTAWTGAWLMPDQSLMTAFAQATGPVDPTQRQLAPKRVIDSSGLSTQDPTRDFWGLRMSVKYLSSTDGGQTWIPAREDRFKALYPAPYLPQATVALHDGTLIRRVNGDDLRFDPSVPHTAFFQRLAPGAKDWGPPQTLLDPSRYTYQISRIRYLRDGRLVATGNVWQVPASTPPPQRVKVPSTFLLMVSADQGKTWRNGMTQEEGGRIVYMPGEEWDTAELPSGDLVALMRTRQSSGNPARVRKQALLRKRGESWVMTEVRNAPFPNSGHPELLTTQEGPVLSIASTGIDYTKDGRTWTHLNFSPKADYKSNYYPRAVQSDDGVVHVFSHVGGDDPYGAVDQSITLDEFQLAPGSAPPTG